MRTNLLLTFASNCERVTGWIIFTTLTTLPKLRELILYPNIVRPFIEKIEKSIKDQDVKKISIFDILYGFNLRRQKLINGDIL